MKLKRIELNGFKSFQSKSIFNIDSNLIGIVGPNGSGKSNIIDAIRWVLGEQSAKNLRGSNMKDVIFAGSESKQSKNFAEVSIVFDTEDMQEKIITRRVYKNGDSEYLVNDKKSKLKDITDLYFDLGISKESYSIITQGRVENLISSKPQDRRVIIEESAGVLKYKNKKKESALKLEKTQENISRLKDIFIEIEERHQILLEQKTKTEKYFEYTDELREKDISLTVYNIKTYENQLVDKKDELEKLLLQKEEIEKNINVIDDKIEKNKEKIHENEVEYNLKKEEEIELIKNIERVNYNIQLLREKSSNREENKEKIKRQLADYLTRKEEVTRDIENTKEQTQRLKAELKEVNKELAKLEELSTENVEEIERKIEDLKNQYFNLISRESKLENELELNKRIETSKNQSKDLILQDLERLKKDLVQEQENSKFLSEEKVNVEKELREFNTDEKKISNELSALVTERTDIFNKIQEGKNLQANLENKQEFLQNKSTGESYYNIGVKEILGQKEKFSGVHDVVANILKLENKYSTALDIALASFQQNIIVDNSECARLCVEHLKNKSKGRATFLPISNIKSRSMDEYDYNAIKNEEGFIDVASNLVTYSKEYTNIVKNLLARVIVTDSLLNANRIAKKLNYKYKLVTLDGQVINSGGSISGGSIQKSANSLIRAKAEIEELTSNIVKVKDKLKQLYSKLELVDKEQILKQKTLENLKNNIIDKEKFLSEIDFKYSVSSENLDRLTQTIENETLKLNDLNVNNTKEDVSFEQKISEIKDALKNIDAEIEKENLRKQNITSENTKVTEQINSLRIKKSQLQESINYKNEFLMQLDRNISYVLEQEDKLNDQLVAIDQVKIELEGLSEYSIEQKEYSKSLEILKEIIVEILNNKELLSENDKEYIEEQKACYKKLEDLHKKVEIIKISSSKLEVKLEEYVNYISNNYMITYEKAEEIFNSNALVDIVSYKDVVRSLKTKIDNLGKVNLNAVEEYNEVKERYDFYKFEIDDLVESKEKLQSTIKKIDTEVTERFSETFTRVADNFSRIYKILFKGGDARLILEDPNNLLETGIDIEASPPGKKLQKLSLLSGGEKALTAISLLFAILEIKQSPFVILDEVEAALDDVNVSRFARFLKHYSKDNQFLVISHRRGTMEEMDKLYGVTMKEKGVSYIMSIDLNSILEEDFISE